MKKIFALAIAMLSLSALHAQPNVGYTVNWYGVDFSKAKAFAASEAGWEFKDAFDRINTLVIAEWNKYNPGRFLDKDIAIRDISPTSRVNRDMDSAEITSTSSGYYISKDEVAEMVKLYQLKETEGTGLVVIGELLDKSTYMGTFIVVYFDIATREVLHGEGMTGKAHGFGLRNYWAGSLLEAMKRGSR
jgi:hypothetical protein